MVKKTTKLAVNVEYEKLPHPGPKKVTYFMPKPVPKWKARTDLNKKGDQLNVVASSFGLSIKEKQNIPIDVEGSTQNVEDPVTLLTSSSTKDTISIPPSEPDMGIAVEKINSPSLEAQKEC
ncbi:OLC1v1036623C1 [Oldenlandia corymbosa var. corymbosa]|uniref:OLC1v1036623C1 n=1 Tax=Oldenlandia corymbosa var. corymbosa TaxID=529605 RepID=A0AAV1CYF8_OLDCO|nr:OLC1v1036623C1 [Oldenlandia corymbosa var. corymbosa]